MKSNKLYTRNIGIYIHIPFCNAKCNYCDFLSFSINNDDLKKRYIDALKMEIANYPLKLQYLKSKFVFFKKSEEGLSFEDISNIDFFNTDFSIDTIYFGGGTPSSVPSKYIGEILDSIRSCFNVQKNAEITIECNPESITKEKLEDYVSFGINRISIGLQSTNNCILKSIRKNTFF